jgi:hypothetical protein
MGSGHPHGINMNSGLGLLYPQPLRSDRTGEGLSSIQGGRGVWHFSVECLREFVHHSGFEIIEERQPKKSLRKRYPWWCALTRPI